jgi:uncharacterized protein (DUF488 family)
MQTVLFTIGYQGRSSLDLVIILQRNGVQKVLDVRANPYSRRREFGGPVLRQQLELTDIAYTHAPELGNPFRGAADGAWREQYSRHLAEHPELVAAALTRMGGQVCCLLCMEADPAQCHRTLAAAAIRERCAALEVKAI